MRADRELSSRARVIAALLVVAAGCDRGEPPGTLTGAPPSTTPSATPPLFRRCLDEAPPNPEAAGFVHERSTLIARSMLAVHHAQDAMALPDAPFSIAAKFSYGEMGKDVEDEPVRAWVDDCKGLVELPAARTDDDGRATFAAPGLPPGAYALHFAMAGDATRTRATAWVLPAGTELVVFDIDGTLTTDDAEVNHDVLDERFEGHRDGSYRAQAYAYGDALAQLWASKGFVPVYITGRPYWLCEHSRQWLQGGGYPPGLVHTTDRHRDVAPRIDGVGRFKADFLAQLHGNGYRIAAAYGNAATDVWAYAQAGLPASHTFIIGPHGGEGGTVGITGDWAAALPWVRQHADAAQPFAADQ
jgi:hypothetical protein